MDRIDDFEMQLIEFQSSSIWKQKFIDVRVDLENIKKRRLEKGILEGGAKNELLRAWNAILENFSCLTNFATTSLTMFLSTYACESFFQLRTLLKSRNRSSLTDETSSSCMSPKVTKYKTDVKSLVSGNEVAQVLLI